MSKVTCHCGRTTMNFRHISLHNGYKAECCKIVEEVKAELQLAKECRVENKTLHSNIIKSWLSTVPENIVWINSTVAFKSFQVWLLSSECSDIGEFTQTRFGLSMKQLCSSKRTSKGVKYNLDSFKDNLAKENSVSG